MDPDLHPTCVRIVCPIPGRRCSYGPESRATYVTRITHIAGSRFSRPQAGNTNGEVLSIAKSRIWFPNYFHPGLHDAS